MKSKKRKPSVANEATVKIDLLTGQMAFKPVEGKNPAAVALGRLGGLKGGHARARKLSKTERSEIARLAAESRWKKNGTKK